MVCLGNMCVDTLHKGDNDGNNNYNNSNHITTLMMPTFREETL